MEYWEYNKMENIGPQILMCCYVFWLLGATKRANELYRQAIDNSRSMMELQQAYIAHKVFTTQVDHTHC